MIESAQFTNVNGSVVAFNDAELPFSEFHTSVDTRMTEIERSQQHGLYPSNTFLGKRLFNTSGDLLENTSADYWTKRLAMIAALTPRPHLGYTKAGTLQILFSGMSEALTCDCTIDGWPDLPLVALSPSAGKWQVNFKAFDPRMYGVWQTAVINFGSDNPGGRSYNKTYNHGYTGTGYGGNTIITNAGNIETYPVLEFHGPYTNPAAILYRGDGTTLVMTLNGLTIAPGQVITVDTLARTVTDTTGNNYYSYATGSDWWALEPSIWINTVRITGGSATSFTNFKWRNAYMI